MATQHKNYSSLEKKVFINILKNYSGTIENKKSSATSLRDKEEAWMKIVEEYNSSSIVTEQRSVKQLKKLWANLKQGQRDALTKEKQSIFLTGGGSPSASASLDPDISIIVPHLMATAPTMFTSSMDEETLKRRENQVIIEDETMQILQSFNQEHIDNPIEEEEATLINEEVYDAGEVGQPNTRNPKRPSTSTPFSTPTARKKRAGSTLDLDLEEKQLKARRVQLIMQRELELFELAKAKSQYELRAAKATAELAELLLLKEKNK